MEQDGPLDPLNIGRNCPGAVITGTHSLSDLLKQFGLGLIFRIFPVYVIRNIHRQARPIQVILHNSYLLHV